MKIAMAQINPIVGDLEGNVEKIKRLARYAIYRESKNVQSIAYSNNPISRSIFLNSSSFNEAVLPFS